MRLLKALADRIAAFVVRFPAPLKKVYVWLVQRQWGARILDYSGGNKVTLHFGRTSGLKVSFFGTNNHVVIHEGVGIQDLVVHIVANGVKLIIHSGTQVSNGYFWIGGENSRVTIGANSFLIDNRIVLTDSDSQVQIGPGCMLGTGAQIRLGDGHTLYDASLGTILNKGHHVVLESRVWLAQDVLVLKNVVVGENSVVGAKSVVTRDIPAGSVAVGIPAKIVRSGIKWRCERIDDLPEGWFDDAKRSDEA